MPDTKTPEAKTTDAPEVVEVPWSDDDVNALCEALQRIGPFYLGNDVRSVESAKAVALQILEANEAMNYEVLKAKSGGALAAPKSAEEAPVKPVVAGVTAGNPR